MTSDRHQFLLRSMSGSALYEVSAGYAALRLDFITSESRQTTIYSLKTGCYVGRKKDEVRGYADTIADVLPRLYRNIDCLLTSITVVNGIGSLEFSSNDVFEIIDREKMWDNNFIVEYRSGDRSEDFIF